VCNLDNDLGADGLNELEELSDNSLLKQAEAMTARCASLCWKRFVNTALERLNDSGESDRIRQAHAQFLLELVEQTLPYQFNYLPDTWKIRLAAEHANQRAALEWCKTGASRSRLDAALRLGRNLVLVPERAFDGRLCVVREAVTRTAALGSTLSRGKALLSAGGLAFTLGKYVEGHEHLRQSVAIARDHQDRQLLAPALSYYGMVLTGLGDYTAGLKASSEAVELARTLHNDWRLAFTLMMLGQQPSRPARH